MYKKIKENLALKGYVETRFYDSKTIPDYRTYLIAKNNGLLDKFTIKKLEGNNRIVDVGIQQIINLLVAANTNYPA